MLYIHIPFCKSRCTYCNFFSTTKLELRQQYVQALMTQLQNLPSAISQQPSTSGNARTFSTIYLGGGTPSVLPQDSLAELLAECHKHLATDGEFTIECNPDDITPDLADLLYNKGVNRVSLGIQTFDDQRLRFVNRRHTAQKARDAVSTLRHSGINNISIDLMYGFPGETLHDWQQDIQQALALQPDHISAYCLTIEEGTPLHRLLKQKNSENSKNPENHERPVLGDYFAELPDTLLEQMFYTLRSTLLSADYQHYELSNFCKPNRHSRHNSGYWQDRPYLALGAAAHGYQTQHSVLGGSVAEFPQPPVLGESTAPVLPVAEFQLPTRYWNIANVEQYIHNVNHGLPVIEGSETIDPATHYNDLITTAMRTARGLSAEYIRQTCGEPYATYFQQTAQRLTQRNLLTAHTTHYTLHPQSLFIADSILVELIWT